MRTIEANFEACVDIRELVNKVSSYDDWREVPTGSVIISILAAFKSVSKHPRGGSFVCPKAFPELSVNIKMSQRLPRKYSQKKTNSVSILSKVSLKNSRDNGGMVDRKCINN